MAEAPSPALSLDQLDLANAAARTRFNQLFSELWPEFAQTDDEFAEEIQILGPHVYWMVVDTQSGHDVGTLAIERVTWNPPDAPPIAFLALPEGRIPAADQLEVLRGAIPFCDQHGFDVLRVLAWEERDAPLVAALAALPGWAETDWHRDVGLEITPDLHVDEPVFPEGMRVVTLADRPELLRGMYECLDEAVADVPGDVPEIVPPWEEYELEHKQERYRPDACFIAVAERDPERVLGFAQVVVPAATPTIAWHGFTAVRPEARGRGLARNLKIATIRRAKELGITMLRTENEERNAPMRAINAALGYQPLPGRVIVAGPHSAL